MAIKSVIEILRDAKERKYGVGSFNVLCLDQASALIHCAERLNSPIIITVPSVVEPYLDFEELSAITYCAAEKVSVPVALHLSHGRDLNIVKKAIEAGFSSVMIDGSSLTFEDNVILTREAAKIGHENNVAVEGELGAVGSVTSKIESTMTDPKLAGEFVRETNIDIFAVSIGNSHGFYKGPPRLDFDRFIEIRDSVSFKKDLFFTLHGGTGIPADDIKYLIAEGMTKIAIYTEMCAIGKEKAFEYLAKHVDYEGNTDLPELLKAIFNGFIEVAELDMKIFNSTSKIKTINTKNYRINPKDISDITKKVLEQLQLRDR